MESEKIIIALTKKGSILGRQLAGLLQIPLKIPQRFVADSKRESGFDCPVGMVIQEEFFRQTALILIMATGVAVRSIAPVIKSKLTDPAVLVLDEEGRFVISLLSGHWGGANELAVEIAQLIGATPVVTTASDLNNLPSLDMIAKENQLLITQPSLLPQFAAAIVNGDSLVIWDCLGIEKTWPENVRVETGVFPQLASFEKLLVILGYEDPPLLLEGVTTIALRPSCLTVGIGCCSGVPGVRIIGAIRRYFREHHWSIGSINQLATIDFKGDEPGIIEASRELGVPLVTFTKGELQEVLPGLNVSEFVEGKIGVGGVCEPAAILAANRGQLIGPKMNLSQITVAVALDNSR